MSQRLQGSHPYPETAFAAAEEMYLEMYLQQYTTCKAQCRGWGGLITLSLGESIDLVQHKSDDTVPGSDVIKALSIHSSHLAHWLLGLCKIGSGTKKKRCSVRREGWFQAMVSSSGSENTQKQTLKTNMTYIVKILFFQGPSLKHSTSCCFHFFMYVYICIFIKYPVLSSIPRDCPILLRCTTIEWLAMP